MKGINQSNSFRYLITCLMVISLATISCKKFVDIGGPEGGLDATATFNNEGSAKAAVLSFYSTYESDIAVNLAACGGLSADDLVTDDAVLAEFQNNGISLGNFYNSSYMWGGNFRIIRFCNLAISGLTQSTALSSDVKNQLLGEALFMRAYAFFNLVNLYGSVPLSISAVEGDNALLPRSAANLVFGQTISDLEQAKSLLKLQYPSEKRTRANQYVVSTLLARIYLYQKNWEKAEAESSIVITSNTYSLVQPGDVFKNNSNETILQLYNNTGASIMAASFLPSSADVAPLIYLRDGFDQIFEQNALGTDDLRKTNWVGADNVKPYVYKYKIPSGAGDEYTVLFRLAELYLIRAEARAMQNKLTGLNSAETDLNEIRINHGGLDKKLNLDQSAMLKAIQQENRVEFFGEEAHRWFDLKRSQGQSDPAKVLADEILPAVKGQLWKPEAKLFPVPGSEFILNSALIQNPGY